MKTSAIRWLMGALVTVALSATARAADPAAESAQPLGPPQRTGTRVLMVSFDAVRDTPAALKGFERLHHIDDPRWVDSSRGFLIMSASV